MTASHLPYTRNGLKFFTKKGGLTSPEVEEICDKAARKYANRFAKVSTTLPMRPTKVDFMRAYAKHLRDIIKEKVNHPYHYDTPLKGFQVFLSNFYCMSHYLCFVLLPERESEPCMHNHRLITTLSKYRTIVTIKVNHLFSIINGHIAT